MNNVCITGRLTKDVELRYTQNGVASAQFTLAVDRKFKDNQGNKVCDFISCVAWRTQAEFLSKYANKGNMIALSGSIQTRQYQDQNGQTRYVTEIIAESVENLSPREYAQQPQQAQAPTQSFTEDVSDNDLPF